MDRKYDIELGGRMGTLIAKDEGPKIMAREGRRDSGMERKVVKALTGAVSYDFDPFKVRALHDSIFVQIIPEFYPEVTSSILAIPASAKPMLRHKAVTQDGKVIIFRQGAGDLVRIQAHGGEEEEWLVLPKRDIVGEFKPQDRGEEDSGPTFVINEEWILTRPEDLPQESSSILQVVDNTHLYNRRWAAGRSVINARGKYDSIFLMDDLLVYPARSVTECSIFGEVCHAVRIEEVYGRIPCGQ